MSSSVSPVFDYEQIPSGITFRKELPHTISPSILFTASSVFYTPETGWYRLSCLGAGGGGAAGVVATDYTNAVGGAGGGYTEKIVFLSVKDALFINVGAGGAGGSSIGDSNGSNGGSSWIKGPLGLYLIATGGAGGFSFDVGYAERSLPGYGSGGTMNFRGGYGGTYDGLNSGGYYAYVGSGGAAGTALGNGGDGAGSNNVNNSVGGAAVGEKHAEHNNETAAGVGGIGLNALLATTDKSYDGVLRNKNGLFDFTFDIFMAFTGGPNSTVSGPGAGGGGITGTSSLLYGGSGGTCGGGGAVMGKSGVTVAYGGSGGLGAGGGAAANNNTSARSEGGSGGNGSVAIQRVG